MSHEMKPESPFLRYVEIAAVCAPFIELSLFIYEHCGGFVATVVNRTSLGFFVFSLPVLLGIINYYPASRLRYILRRIKRLFEREPLIKWFVDRNNALPDMQAHWQHYSSLTFIAISHTSLRTYFESTLKTGRELPWANIEIYFADEQLGRVYENHDFSSNLKKSRQEIVALLTSPEYRNLLVYSDED